MDENTVHMWTAECLEPIKDQVGHALLLLVMSKIMWAITQAYQTGLLDGDSRTPPRYVPPPPQRCLVKPPWWRRFREKDGK